MLRLGTPRSNKDAPSMPQILSTYRPFEEKFLLQLALNLGSDVPFCLLSTKTPRLYGESRGEEFKKRLFNFNFDEYFSIYLVIYLTIEHKVDFITF